MKCLKSAGSKANGIKECYQILHQDQISLNILIQTYTPVRTVEIKTNHHTYILDTNARHSSTGKEQLASCKHCTMANMKKQSHVISIAVKKIPSARNDFHTSEDK